MSRSVMVVGRVSGTTVGMVTTLVVRLRFGLSMMTCTSCRGIARAGQSVVRGVGGQDREPESLQVFRIHHAAVVVAFDEQDGLRSWYGTCLSGTAVKRPSNPRQVR